MWNDEAETAMYAQNILKFGYPKVHDGKNVVYVYDESTETRAYDRRTDAYLNTGWLQFYFAAPAVWVAGHFDNPYVRTAILRLPFALAALASLALMGWIVIATHRRRGLVFSAFVGLCMLCIPIILHMREVRYYALALLFTACAIWLVNQYCILERIAYRKYATLLCITLLLLFLTFHPIFFAFLTCLGLYALRHIRTSWRAVARELLPLVVASVLVIPGIVFFRTLTLSHAINDINGFSAVEYVKNFGTMFIDLAQNAMFIPALIATTLAMLVWRSAPDDLRANVRAVARLLVVLWLFAIVTVSIVSGAFLLYQRYYLVLMPLFVMAFLCAVRICYALLPGVFSITLWPRLRHGIIAGLCATVIVPIVLSWESIAGHIHEIINPYQGTIDVTVTYIRAHYADPAQLVIATNYEEHAYMYYLQSRVIIGQALNNLPEDIKYQPDIIIPRQLWKFNGYAYFDAFRRAAPYKEVTFPIRDFFVNNLPETRHPFLNHQFRNLRVGNAKPMMIYVLNGIK
ncbi:MAG: hypothetical protein Q8O51_01340 [bacterium]|nr:hypothetical protein [bacterium]